MSIVAIRFPKISDAERLLEIISNKNFIYYNVNVRSVAEERKWIANRAKCRKNNVEWNYVITYGEKVVGAIGIKINQHRKYIGEIGYFVDEKHWGRGVASRAVKLVEREGFKKLGLKRIEIQMRPENKASERVAIKNKYKKEGLLKKSVRDRAGKMKNTYLYAKVL